MAFNGDYASSQGADAGSFTLTDTSTGSDVNLTGRTISLYKTDGSLLVPVITWAIANSTYDLTDVLAKDYSLLIKVEWASSSPLGSPSTYTKEIITTFVEYTQDFKYGLIQQWSSANPPIQQKSAYWQNMMRLIVDISNAIEATNYSNQYSAQAALDDAFYLQQNANKFF